MEKKNRKQLRMFVANTHRMRSKILGSQGFYIGQIEICKYIHNNPGCKQQDIAKALELDKTTIAKAIKKLEKRGTVRKERCEEDKRSYLLYFESLDPETKKSLLETTEKLESIMFNGFSNEEVDKFFKYLERINSNMCNEFGGKSNEKCS